MNEAIQLLRDSPVDKQVLYRAMRLMRSIIRSLIQMELMLTDLSFSDEVSPIAPIISDFEEELRMLKQEFYRIEQEYEFGACQQLIISFSNKAMLLSESVIVSLELAHS